MSSHELQNILFGEAAQQQAFHTSDARHGMFDAIKALSKIGLVEEGQYKLKITPSGRQVLADPIEYWTAICGRELDAEEQAVLNFVNKQSPQNGTNPDHAWLKDVEAKDLLEVFGILPPPIQSNEHQRGLSKYVYDLPKLLEDRNFMETRGRAGYRNDLKPTYEGLIWGTWRGFTIESKFIDELVDEWETTNVDFKREIGLDTKKQKAEIAKDVLGLANTKSSGRRYLIVGFDDKARAYHSPPDVAVTQDRMERILANLTDPVTNVRYEIVDYRLGKVGKLEIFREVAKLPYRAAKDMIVDEKGKKS